MVTRIYILSFQSRKSTEYVRREIGALVAQMNRDVPATMDQCTQTPFPGSELIDPNPFVPSPIKPKVKPGVGDKRALPIDAVCIPILPCHIVARPATELRPTVASRRLCLPGGAVFEAA